MELAKLTMRDEIIITSNDLSICQVYTCKSCGIKRHGDPETVSFYRTTLEGLRDILEAVPLRARNMPIGWSSSPEGYNCGCKSKRNTASK